MRMRPVVHLVGCGSRPTSRLPSLASALRASGWDPCIVPSPTGRRFLDVDEAERSSGRPVRWEFDPDDPVELPPAQAVVVAPATFNTVVKLAAGSADTLALAVTAEAIGKGLPVLVVPWTNADLAAHPAYAPAVRTLREWGLHVVPADQSDPFPWAALRDRLHRLRTPPG
ncbi:flavoprotein [Streptomyces pactum]|uniref:Flavoprotein n=1 Tax=Streptomyces pactum TaxID=68249 RepID=A0ABS0NSC7_9ACTN|nr:flavoprotein [Streptomyces pactum]